MTPVYHAPEWRVKLRFDQPQFTIIFKQGPISWGAYVPALPGVVAVGDTREEVAALIAEAIDFHLDGLRAEGLPPYRAATVREPLWPAAAAQNDEDAPRRHAVAQRTARVTLLCH